MQSGSKPLPQFGSAKVATRCALRSAAMGALAAFSSQGFAKSFVALIAICAMFCVLVAMVRREPMFGTTLTHWDECATYVALCFVVLLIF